MADVSKITASNGTTFDIKDANVPHSSEASASGGTTLSLVTTGEKYAWDGKAEYVELTQNEYDQLSYDEKHNGTMYFITDGQSSITVDADDVDYDNTSSGLVATDVQAAIDELASGSSSGSGIHSVIGTQVATTSSWTGVLSGVSALYDGLTINYYLPYAAASSYAVSLNLTLDDGTTTGAKLVEWNANNDVTVQYKAGSTIQMVYYSAGSISKNGTATVYDMWICDAGSTEVKQNTLSSSSNTNYPVLTGVSSNSNTTGPTYKDFSNLKYNPSTTTLSAPYFSGNISNCTGLPITSISDVQLTSPSDNDLLVYDSNLSGGKTWKNAKKTVVCTQAQFDAWDSTTPKSFPYTDCQYIITDAPALQYSAADLSYDGGTDSVYDVVEEVKGDVADNASDITALQTGKADKTLLNDIIKIKYFTLPAANVTQNMDVSSNLVIDSGYKFLCYAPNVVPDGFTTDQYIWISAPNGIQGRPWWGTNPIAGVGTSGKLRFYYFEIRNV